jgi:hypothetical protein
VIAEMERQMTEENPYGNLVLGPTSARREGPSEIIMKHFEGYGGQVLFQLKVVNPCDSGCG